MKTLFGFLLLMTGLLLAPHASASDLILSRAVLEDVSGTLTIADVARREIATTGPALPVGSTNSVYWMHLRIKAPADGSKAVLFIRPNYLNEIRLYVAGPGNPQNWETRVTGNRYAYSQRDRTSMTLGFVVNVTAPEATYYLRIKTRNSLGLSVEALDLEEAEQRDHHRDLIMVFFVTSMLFLVLWAFHSYLLEHQRVVGLFALHQVVYTLYGIAATGYFAPLSPAGFPQLSDEAELVLYLAINFTILLFCRELFKPYEPPRFLMHGLNLLLCISLLLLLALTLGYDTLAVNANSMLIKFSWPYLVAMTFTLRVEHTPKRRILQIFFVSVLLNNELFWFAQSCTGTAFQGILGAIRVLIVDGLIIGGLFALILHMRTRQVLLEGQQSTLELLLMQKKLELEQELKRQIEVQAQTDYLTGMHNRRHFVALAERELLRAIRFQRPCTLLVIDVDHFKAINDTWGHGNGDVVLQQVARLMREALREEDLFGRTGGEEFAAVLVETEGAQALDVATRLCASVSEAIIVPPGSERIPVSVSIGLAQLRGRNIDFNRLQQEADHAMYCAKQAGRNRAFVDDQDTPREDERPSAV
jgi:diguanylate cyclase (GGDEF)-like protein